MSTQNTANASIVSVGVEHSSARKELENTIFKMLRVFSHFASLSIYIKTYNEDEALARFNNEKQFVAGFENHRREGLIYFTFLHSDASYIFEDAFGNIHASANVIVGLPEKIMSFFEAFATYYLFDFDYKLSGNLKFGVERIDDYYYRNDLCEDIISFNFDTIPDCFLRESFPSINAKLRNFSIYLEFVEAYFLADFSDETSEKIGGSFEEVFDFMVANYDKDFSKLIFLCEASSSIDPVLNLVKKQHSILS